MDWTAFTERFLADRRGRGDAPGSLDVYRLILTTFAGWYEETTGHAPFAEGVTGIDGAEHRVWLAGRRKPGTVNNHVRVLRMAFRWAVVAGKLERNPLQELRRIPVQAGEPKAIDRRVLGNLLGEAQRSGSTRDVTLITLLAQTGLRISEALALTWGDVTIREVPGRSSCATAGAASSVRRR